MARVFRFDVEGESISVDLDEVMVIADATSEAHVVAADVAWWGGLLAAAESTMEDLDTFQEHTFAKNLALQLQADDKIAEWKAKARAEAAPEFRKLKDEVSKARKVAGQIRSIHSAFVRKNDMIRSLVSGAEPGERRAANHVGRLPSDPQKDPRYKTVRDKRGQQTGKRCSVCGEPQHQTPSGATCSNGHGGAPEA